MSRAERILKSQWESNKEHIRVLYLDQDKTLDELVRCMAENHGFRASRAQYIRKLDGWNMKKNSTKDNWKHAGALIKKREIDGKETEIVMNGRVVPLKKLKKELGRYAWQQYFGSHSLAATRENSPEGVIARTPPSSAAISVRTSTIPWFLFQSHLHSLIPQDSLRSAIIGNPRPALTLPNWQVTQADVIAFAKVVLPYRKPVGDAETLVEVMAAIKAEMPDRSDLDSAVQFHGLTTDPWAQFFQWAVYRCTNNFLSRDQTDNFVSSISTSGAAQLLQQICRMPGPATKILLSNLLFSAVRRGDASLTRLLLNSGADPETQETVYGDRTVLQTAALLHKPQIVQMLLDRGADPNKGDWCPQAFNSKPVLLALTRPRGVDIVDMLVRAGAVVNPPHHQDQAETPLMRAAANRDKDAAKLLITVAAEKGFFFPELQSVLQIAVEKDDLEMVEMLLAVGADPNVGANCTCGEKSMGCGRVSLPLVAAAVACNGTQLVQCLLRAGADINGFIASDSAVAPCAKTHHTPLQASISRCDYTMVKFLLDAGASANTRDDNQPSPLQQACARLFHQYSQRHIIHLLLQSGADVNAAPPPIFGGETASQAVARSGDLDILTLLVSKGGDVNTQALNHGTFTCLQTASYLENIELARLLLSLGADVNSPASKQGLTALQAASSRGNTQLVDLLLAMGADVNFRSSNHQETSLGAAIDNGHISVVEKLLDAGADINQSGLFTPAVRRAICNKNYELFDFLVAKGADLSSYTRSSELLVTTIRHRSVHASRLLIEAGVDVNQPYTEVSRGRPQWMVKCPTVPLSEAVLTGEVALVELLLDAGAKFDGPGSRGLDLAVYDRRTDIVRLLLQRGANPNQLNPDNLTPLHLAVKKRRDFWVTEDEGGPSMGNMGMNLDILKMLIAYGADVNGFSPGGRYPLQIVCDACSSSLGSKSELADYTIARELLLQAGADSSLYSEAKQQEESVESTRTELQSAAYNNDLDRVRRLISSGENVNEPAARNRGATALQYAAMMGHFDMAVLLLESGAAINAPGAANDGRTALQGAAEHGRLDIVHLLLENDDGMEFLEARCRDAATYAEREGHQVIAQILREWKRP